MSFDRQTYSSRIRRGASPSIVRLTNLRLSQPSGERRFHISSQSEVLRVMDYGLFGMR